jgi:putative PLP-dependent aminotransferase (TIGR04422 family)
MGKHTYFLWPREQAPKMTLTSSTTAIEAQLASMFSNAHPVLVPSGRSGLLLCLMAMGLDRADKIGVFPFASHCVLEAISRVATPAPTNISIKSHVIYHQWGYVTKHIVRKNDIEDAVDTLYCRNADLLIGGGRFEIWSLSKIIGALGGGVIWCREISDMNKIRSIRDSRKDKPNFQWMLRVLGRHSSMIYDYWAGTEALSANLPKIAMGNIYKTIRAWDEIVLDRQTKFNILAPYLPNWLKPHKNRLPTVICIEMKDPQVMEHLVKLGVQTGIRHFERILKNGKTALTPVIPLPIHQDVPVEKIKQMAGIISKYNSLNSI